MLFRFRLALVVTLTLVLSWFAPAGARADAVPRGGEFSINTYTAGNQLGSSTQSSSVAADANGNFVVVWASADQDGSLEGIYGQRFAANGAKVGPEFRVNTTTFWRQTNPVVAMSPSGSFVVVWQDLLKDGDSYGIYLQQYDSAGNPVGVETRVNDYTTSFQVDPSIAMNAGGDYVVTWASNGQDGSLYGTYAKRYNANGSQKGPEFKVSTYSTDTQAVPNVALDDTGRFVITWSSRGQDGSGYGIYFQRYDAAGVPVGGETRANTYVTSDQLYSTAGIDSSGNFVLSWTSTDQDGSGDGIYARLFDWQGNPAGPEFVANTQTAGRQYVGKVAMNDAGRFIVLWRSDGQDGSGEGIYAQLFNANGAANGGELRVNTYTANNQSAESAVYEGNRLVLVWGSNLQDGSAYGMYGQRYYGCDPITATAPVTLSGPTSFCAGGNVTLTAGAGSSWLWSNGATTQAITVSTSGSYSVAVTDANGCVTTSVPVTVTVTAVAAPPVSFDRGAVCPDGNATASVSSSYSSYAWTIAGGSIVSGAGTNSVVFHPDGTGAVTLTADVSDATGCHVTGSATIPLALPATVAAGGPTTFCDGGSVTLTASSGTQYLWSNGATSQSISVTAGGSYTVTVTDAYGCLSTSAPTGVTVNALPASGIHETQIYDDSGSGTITRTGDTIEACGNPTVRLIPLALNVSYTYNWSTGATTAILDVHTSGTYSVTVTTPAGCATTSTVTVHYGAIPAKPVIAPTSTELCPAGGSVTLTAPAADGWTWSTGATTQSIVVSEPGSYTVTVRSGACQSVASDPVLITTGLSTISTNDSLALCGNASATLTANGGTSWLWSNGATTQSIVVTAPGTFRVTTTNDGCTMPESSPVTVTQRAVTIGASSPTTFCEGGSVTLTAGGGTSWLWTNGATTQSITVYQSGSYGVTGSFADGCAIAATPVAVEARHVTASITADRTTVCPDGAIALESSVGGGAGYTYQWYDNTYAPIAGATGPTLTIAPSTSGFVYLKVTDALGCQATSNAVLYTVVPQPDATIAAPAAVCEGQSGAASVADGGPGTTYSWTISGGTLNFPNSSNVTFTPTDLGAVMLTVTVANAGCSSTSSQTVAVNPLPSATIAASGPTTFCQGGAVTLNAPAGASYLWSNGATTPSINVSTSGSYSVTVTSASGCSATSSATSVTVNALPAATITPSGSTTFCAGGSVTLTASAGSSWLWSTGATTQSIAVSGSGSYNVTVTNANGCSATSAPTSVTVNALPAATITPSGPTTFCTGGSVTLTASAGSSWLWSTGATTPSINVSISGSYGVTVTNAGGCSTTSSTTSVTVHPLPAATVTASGPTTFCAGGSVTLTASAGASWLWSNGATTQSIGVTQTGSYSVSVTNANGCTATSAATSVTANPMPAPTITASGPTTICSQGGSVSLTGNGGSGQWYRDGSYVSSASSIVVGYPGGTYVYRITTAAGCSADSAPVTVTPISTYTSYTGYSQVCWDMQSAYHQVNGALAGSTFAWTVTGGTLLSGHGQDRIDYRPDLGSTNVSITVTVTGPSGCANTSTFNIPVDGGAKPVATAQGPTTFCPGGSVTLAAAAAPSGWTYQWSTGATTQSITVAAGGTYTVHYRRQLTGCLTPPSDPIVVTIASVTPTITAGGPTTFCPGGSVTLTASAGSSYLWSTGATTPSIVVSAAGNYTVTVTNASGCSGTSAAKSVTVNAATAITSQPPSKTIPKNTSTSLSVTATGSGTLTYQWYKGTSPTTTTPIAGATAATYTTPVLSKGTYRYWVRVTGTCGVVNSSTATVTAN